MVDMTQDIFADYPFGKAARHKLEKLYGPLPENFRFYDAFNHGGLIGMQVSGAEFRRASSGPNKGLLTIIIPSTRKSVFLSREEIAIADLGRPLTKTSASLPAGKIEINPKGA